MTLLNQKSKIYVYSLKVQRIVIMFRNLLNELFSFFHIFKPTVSDDARKLLDDEKGKKKLLDKLNKDSGHNSRSKDIEINLDGERYNVRKIE